MHYSKRVAPLQRPFLLAGELAHIEAQIDNFRRWSSIPDVHFCLKNLPKNSHSSSLKYTMHGYKYDFFIKNI